METDQNGLYYMRARYYNQDIKRFINRDIVSGDITNSRSLNRYCYVQENPVSLTDPFGLCPDGNSVFRNLYSALGGADWNAIGHAALDVAGFFWDGADIINAVWYACEGNTKMAITSAVCALPALGMGIGGLMGRSSRLATAGKAVKAAAMMSQGAMGVVSGIEMARTGFTNILNGLESGNIRTGDVAGFIGGIAISVLSGKNMVSSGRELLTISEEAGKLSKAGKEQRVESESGSRTKLNYVTSNGLVSEATPNKTTTVLGTYKDDTGAILDELGNVKSLDFGPRDGGFNLLNTPDELYVSPNQFWNEYNKPWLDNAIARNDIFKIATEPTWDNLTRVNMITGKTELTGFGREYTYLKKHGYYFDTITKTMVK